MNIRCPKCGAEYELDDTLLGRKVECSVCNQKFIIGGHERVPQTPAPLKCPKLLKFISVLYIGLGAVIALVSSLMCVDVACDLHWFGGFWGVLACTSAERITGIPNGSEMMRIMSCENNWDIVVYKNNIGYVCRDYLKVVSNDPNPYSVNPMEFTVMATDKVRMRLGPGTEFPVIGSIGLGDIATVKGVSNEGWVLLTYNDKMGFVSSEYLKTIDEVALAEEHEEYFVQTHPNVYTVSSVNFT